MAVARLRCDVTGLLGLVGTYSVRGGFVVKEPYHRNIVIFVCAVAVCCGSLVPHQDTTTRLKQVTVGRRPVSDLFFSLFFFTVH